MTARVARHSLRARLALTTALAGLLVLPGVAAGQTTLPVTVPVGTAASASTTAGGTGPTISSTGSAAGTSTTAILLGAKNTVINWNDFNVINDGTKIQTLTYTNGTTSAAGSQVAVLNRVTVADVANTTTLTGTINTVANSVGSGVEVWISNPNGILIGNNAAINTQGFVATTLPISDMEFTSGTGGLHLTSTSASDQSSITSSGTFQISTNGGVLAIVAPVVRLVTPGPGNNAAAANGTFDAGAGGAAFVAATDVTMQDAGSPLSLTINRGTTLARGTTNETALSVAGTVTAGTALMVVSAQQFVDTLLNVDANITATAMGGNGIVILAGNASTNADALAPTTGTRPPGTISFDPNATDADLGGGGSLALMGAVGASTASLVLGARGTPPDTAVSTTYGPGAITSLGALTATVLSSRSDGAQALNAAGNAIGAVVALNSINGQVSLTDGAALTVNGSGASGTSVSLEVTGTNTLAVNAPIVSTAMGVSLTGGGGISFGTGASVTGATSVQISGAVALNAGLTVTAQGVGAAGAVTFAGTIDGGNALTVTGAGTKTFTGAVGTTTGALASLMSTGTGTTAINGGAVTTTGAQSYGAVTLGAAGTTTNPSTTTLSSTMAGAIGFAGAVDAVSAGAQGLTVSTTATTTFGGVVGATALASLTTAGPTAINTTAITTTGAQSYGGAVTLGAAPVMPATQATTTLTSTGGGAIGFTSTVDAAAADVQGLAVSTGGTTTLGGVVGTTRLASLDTSIGTGSTTFDIAPPGTGSSVATKGDQGYGAVTLARDTTFSASAGNVGFNGTVDGTTGSEALAVTAAATVFKGQVGHTTALGSVTAGATTFIIAVPVMGASVRTTGTTGQSYGAATLARNTTLDAGSATVAFGGTVDGTTGMETLGVTAGLTTFAGQVGHQPLGSLTTGAASFNIGPVTGASVATAGAGGQSYGAVTLLQDTILSAAAGAVSFSGTIDTASTAAAARQLAITSTGMTTFGGLVGNTRALASLSSTGGTTTFNAAATSTTPTVSTTGDQTYGVVTLGADAFFTGANGAFGTLTGNTHALTLSFNAAGAGNAGTVLNGVTGVTTLASNAGGTTTLNGDVTTSSTQNYGDPVTLNSNATLSAGGTGFTFAGISGAGHDLTLTGTAATAAKTVDASFTGIRNLATTGAGKTTLSGTIATTGTQAYGDAVTLASATTTVSSSGTGAAGALGFTGTVDAANAGAQGLTVSTAGTATFGGLVGNVSALASLSVTNGATVFNVATPSMTASVKTSAAAGQSYTGAVTLASDTVLDAGTGGVTFNGLVDSGAISAKALTVATSGMTTFKADVGTNPLASLSTSGPVTIGTTAGSVNITTAGNQAYSGAVTLGNDARLFGAGAGAVFTASSVIGAGHALSLNFAGSQTVDGMTFTGIGNFSTAGAGTTMLSGPFATSGYQSYGAPVTLTGATMLTSSGNGDIAFLSTLNGAQSLSISTAGLTTLTTVGNTDPLTTLTTNGGGTTTLKGNVSTSDDQNYVDAVTLVPASVQLGAGTKTIAFGSTVGGASALTLASNATAASGLGTGPGVTALTSLAANGSLGLTGDVATSGTQTYGALTLASNAVLTSGDASANAVKFSAAVNSNGTARTLTVSTAGTASFGGLVGNVSSLASLSVTSGATVFNVATPAMTASVKTSAAAGQSYTGAVTLAGDTVLDAGTGGVAFAGTIDGGRVLTVKADGAKSFGGSVGAGTPLAALTSQGSTMAATGSTVFGANAAVVTTSGDQGYAGTVSLGRDMTFTGVNGTFGALTGNTHALTLSFSGATVLDTVGGVTTLTSDNGGTTTLNGNVTTSAAQNYTDAVVLGTSPLRLDAGTGTIAFGGSASGASALTLASNTTAASGLGTGAGATALVSLVANGTLGLTGDVATTGAAGQTYAGAVTLSGPTTRLDAGTATIAFGSTVSGASALTLASNAVAANGLGTGVALTSLATNGTLGLTGNVTTIGAQGYGGLLTLNSNATLSAGGTGFTFAGISGAGYDLTLTGTAATAAKTVDASFTGIRNLATTGAGKTTLSGTIATTGTQAYGDAVTLASATTTVSSSGTGGAGAIGFTGTVDAANAGAQGLTVSTAGTASFGGLVGNVSSLASLSVTSGATVFNVATPAMTASVKTSAAAGQSYTGAVTLAGDTVLDAGTGGVAFAGTIDGGRALTVKADGVKSFGGSVGAGTPLAALTSQGSTMAATGSTVFGANAAVVTTSGDQGYAGTVSLGRDMTFTGVNGTFGALTGNTHALTLSFSGATVLDTVGGVTTLTSDNGGTMRLNGNVTTSAAQNYGDDVLLGVTTTLTAGAGAVSFTGKVDAVAAGSQGLMILTTGPTSFGGLVGNTARLASLATSTGPVAINTTSIKTTGDQGYGGAVTLGSDATLDASMGMTAGNVSFASTVDGARALTVIADGTRSFTGSVGAGTALASLTSQGATTASTGTTAFGASAAVVRTAVVGGSTGSQRYAGAVTLARGVTFSGVDGTFGAIAGGGNPLALSFTGATSLATVAGVTTLVSDNGGTTTLNGNITTTGNQTYADAVALGANVTVAAGSGDVAFQNALTGGYALTITSAGATSFASVGAGTGNALASLTTDAGGTTTLNGNVTTTGNQAYGDAVMLGADVVLTGSGAGATFSAASLAGVGHDLTLDFAGAKRVNGFTTLRNLTTQGAGTTTLSDTIATTGTQNYTDVVALGAATTLSSSGTGAAGNIAFANTLDGGQTLAVNTSGTTSFTSAVGGAAALTSLTTDMGGTTAINGGSVNTSGNQSYGDAVTLGAATVLASSGSGTIGFATTLDGAQTLAVNTAGTTSFGGAVGGTTALASLVTDAGGTTAINGGSIRTSGGQSYRDAVTLGAGATLSSTGAGAIGFATTVDGAQALAVNSAGATGFGGAVGATTALASLTTDAGGTTALNGGSVRTTGNQTYNDTVTLGIDTRLSSTASGTLGFGGTVDGAYLLSLTTGGAVQANGVLGGTTAINGLAVRAGSFAGRNGNRVGTIAADVAGGLVYDDAAALTIGMVDGLSGINSGTFSTIVSAGGVVMLAANVAAGNTSLTGNGITQAAGTSVNAGTGTILIDANDGAIAMAGTLTTANATANAVRIVDSAGAVLGNIATGAGGTVTLGLGGGDNLSGGVGQTAGTTIATGTLLGSIGGAANLTNAGNSIATLGALTANGIALRDSRSGLTVAGPVNAGSGNLALTLDAGTLALQGNLVAATGIVSLTSGGTIGQTGGAIIADTLTGSSTGGASLTSAGNMVTRLAGFTNNGSGGFALTDGRALTVTGDTTAAGDLTINATGLDFTGRTLGSTGALTLVGNGGAVTGTTATGGTNAAVTAASINLGTVRATNGALALTATGAGGVGLTVVTASASGSATLASQAALGVTGSLNAGTSATLTATGAATLGQTTAGSSLTVTANLITAGATKAGTMLSFTSGTGIDLTSAQAGGDALFDASGTASLGAVTAGSSSGITVRALDAQITGAQTAGKVAFVNRAPASVAFKLGNATSVGGFQLSQNEINLVSAGALTFDGGSGNAELGALAFASTAGSTSVSVLATGRIDVLGAVSGSGAGRSFLLGGTATAASDKASVIEVVAKPTGGASLLFDNANLELRGARIGVGQQAGFLTPIGFDGANGQPVSTVSTAYVGNANSALYNSTYGGAAYPTAVTLVSANSLTARYTDYALFQNTGAPGVNAGVMLGGSSSAPVRNALVLDAAGSNNAFALYGTINGISGSGTALLGSQVISFSGSNLANTRVNGCLVGSGGGCLTSVVSQPVLNVFDSSRLNVFQSADDLAVPFDPVVGNNNEALFSGVAVLDGPVVDARCEGSDDPACKAADKKPAPPADEKKGK